jgi:hypothetical protein
MQNADALCPSPWRLPNETDVMALMLTLSFLGDYWDTVLSVWKTNGIYVNGEWRYTSTAVTHWGGVFEDPLHPMVYDVWEDTIKITYGGNIYDGRQIRCVR